MPSTRVTLVLLACVCAVGLATLWLTVLNDQTSQSGARTLFSDGFDSGDLTAWSTATGLAVQRSEVSQGAWAARTTSATSPGFAVRKLATPSAEVTVQARVDLLAIRGTAAVNVLKVRTEKGAALAEVFLTPAGALGLRNDVASVGKVSSRVVTTDAWHTVAVHVVVAGARSTIDVMLDGAPVAALASRSADLGSAPVGQVQVGDNLAGRTADVVYDTVTVTGPGTADGTPGPTTPAPTHSRTATPSPSSTGPTLAAAPVAHIAAKPFFSDGFETGDLSRWSGASGLVAERALVADGGSAVRVASVGAPGYATKVLAVPVKEATVELKLDLESFSGADPFTVVRVRTPTGAPIAELYVAPGRVLGLRDDVTGARRTSATTVPLGRWVTIGVHVVVSGTAGAPSGVDVTLDGAPVRALSGGTAELGTAPIGRLQIGEDHAGRPVDAAFDSVAVTGAPVLAAAGDIACDPLTTTFHGGAGAPTSCRQRAVSDLVLADPTVTAVAALGDVQYQCGGLAAFRRSYDRSWGRFLAMTHPAVGNHEYRADSGVPATDCDPGDDATGYFSYFGSAAGGRGHGWYSYDLGTWHVVVLNTSCHDVGGCEPGTPQGDWLEADLRAHSRDCTLAYYHFPTWTSGPRGSRNGLTFVKALYAHGAEVVLTGHEHNYERFAPQSPDGVADPKGVREFVVGTGGANHTELPITSSAPHSQVRDDGTFGVLKMTLHDGWYDWHFVRDPGQAPEPGKASFADSGSDTCH